MKVYDLSEKIDPFNLPEELQEKAETELKEDLKTRDEAIAKLKDLVEGDKDTKGRMDDEFILRYLRAKKYKMDDAFKTIRNCCKLIRKYPHWFAKEHPKEADRILKEGYHTVLPQTDNTGCIVIVVLFGIVDFDDFTIDDIMRVFSVCCQYVQTSPLAQVNGMRLLCDVKDIGTQHITALTPASFDVFAQFLQDFFPIRFKGFHVVNSSPIFDTIFGMLKPFLKAKLVDRVNFYGKDLKSLHEIVSKDKLPEELGGTMGPMDNRGFRQNLYKHTRLLDEVKKLSAS